MSFEYCFCKYWSVVESILRNRVNSILFIPASWFEDGNNLFGSEWVNTSCDGLPLNWMMRLGWRRRWRKETNFTKLAKYPYLNLQSFIYLWCSAPPQEFSGSVEGTIKSHFPDGTDFYYYIGMCMFYFDSQSYLPGMEWNIDWNRKHFTSVCFRKEHDEDFMLRKSVSPSLEGVINLRLNRA